MPSMLYVKLKTEVRPNPRTHRGEGACGGLDQRIQSVIWATPEVCEGILRRLLKSIGPGAYLEPTFRCEFGFNISVGKRFYANFDCIILDGGGVQIGDYVLFGPRVGIYTSSHTIDAEERVAGACYAKPVTIGHRVWIGGGVNINQGVTIGDNSIVGAGSVVTKDVPSDVIAAGVPCRVIRTITAADRVGFKSGRAQTP
jgi:maltose O-acetyltransferase